MRILVTGAGGSATSNFVDSLLLLEKTSLSIVGVDSSAWMLPLSKLEKNFLVPDARHPNYISTINRICKENQIDVLHAQPDSEVLILSQLRNELNCKIFLPDHAEIVLSSDKFALAKVLAGSSIPTPETAYGQSAQEIQNICSTLFQNHEKLWVRARNGAGSRASLPISNEEQAINWIKWWIEEKGMTWSDFQISEFLPGEEFALQTIWQHGNLVAAEARMRIKYLYGFLSPSGQSSTPSVAKTTSNPKVYEIGISAIKALSKRPNGVYCVDMKTDKYGAVKVTEINTGRFFTTSNFFSHAGVNMPLMSVRAAMGERLSPLPIASLGDKLYWIRMVDMGYRLIHEDDLKAYGSDFNF